MSALAVAFRSSRRNLKRHRGRNILIALMVSLPVTAMVAVAFVHASQTPTAAQMAQAELGNAEARVSQVDGPHSALVQSPTRPDFGYRSADDASPNEPVPMLAELDPSIPGADGAVEISDAYLALTTDDVDISTQVLIGPAWDALLEGRYHLVDGHAPKNTGEALLSPALASRLELALGEHLTVAGKDFTYVGTLAQDHESREFVAVPDGALASTTELSETSWYTSGAALTWDDVQSLNQHGYVAYSRQVFENPPAFDPLAETSPSDDSIFALIAIGFGGGLIAVLLAGSAFAVGLRREQRVLGMFAVTGADRRQVTAISVATGAWLGLLGGFIGAAFGIGIAALLQTPVGFWAFGYSMSPDTMWGLHLPWLEFAAAIGFAVLVGAAAAAIPAMMASRRDPLASLKGSMRPRPVSRTRSIIGVAALAAGIAGIVFGRAGTVTRLASPGPWNGAGVWPLLVTVAAALIFAGGVLAMPLLLAGLTRLATRAPLSARLAVRDAARQSARTIGVVVAIGVSVVAVVTTAAYADQSGRALAARYQPWAPVGSLRVDMSSDQADGWVASNPAPVIAAIRDEVPDSDVTSLNVIPDAEYGQDSENASPVGLSVIVPEANRCPVYHVDPNEGPADMSQVELATDIRCNQWENLTSVVGGYGHVVVGGKAELEALLGKPASPEALAVLDEGGAVLLSAAYLDGDEVTFGIWDQAAGNWPYTDEGMEGVPASTVTLPAVIDKPTPYPFAPFSIVISPATAAKLGVPAVSAVLIARTDGGFTQQQADAIDTVLARTSDLYVIYGSEPQPDLNAVFIRILAIGLLILTITASAVSIGIARVDARNDDATLTSIGSSPGITRLIAMWQALVSVALAAIFGTAVGLALAWAIAPLEPLAPFAVPVPLVAFVVVAMPALIALGALAFTRSANPVAYRLAA